MPVRQAAALNEGISSKVLTEHLRALEEDGLLTRFLKPTSPPSVTYTLTPLEYSLSQAALLLRTWAEDHAQQIAEHQR